MRKWMDKGRAKAERGYPAPRGVWATIISTLKVLDPLCISQDNLILTVFRKQNWQTRPKHTAYVLKNNNVRIKTSPVHTAAAAATAAYFKRTNLQMSQLRISRWDLSIIYLVSSSTLAMRSSFTMFSACLSQNTMQYIPTSKNLH